MGKLTNKQKLTIIILFVVIVGVILGVYYGISSSQSKTQQTQPTTSEIVSMVILLILAVMLTLWLAHGQEVANIKYPRAPLFDRIHVALPELPKLRWIVHVMPLLLLVAVIATLQPLVTVNMLTIYAVVLLLRSAAFWLTRMPPPRQQCEPYSLGGVYLGGCSDMMYSGHTSMIVLSALFLVTYSDNIGLSIVSVVFALMALMLLLMTRHHYSSDIVIALYICCLAFLAFRIRPICTKPRSENAKIALQV